MAPILTRVGQAFGFGAGPSGGAAVEPYSATGGTKKTYGSKTYHWFDDSDTFTVTGTIPACEIILVGGGGAGQTSAGGGTAGSGGGAGGYVTVIDFIMKAGAHSFTIGSGGTGGNPGGDSTFQVASGSYPGNPSGARTLTSLGGGRGLKYSVPQSNDGASGGGGGYGDTAGGVATQPTHTQGAVWTGSPGVTITQVGYTGGIGYSGGNQGGGGGGGAAGVGADNSYGGSGGGAGGLAVLLPATFQQPGVIGTAWDWTDKHDQFYMAGGGGGGTLGSGPTSLITYGGVGPANTKVGPTNDWGRGGGGCGVSRPTSTPQFTGGYKNAQDNTGGGGGGIGYSDGTTGGTGGSGCLLIAYLNSP